MATPHAGKVRPRSRCFSERHPPLFYSGVLDGTSVSVGTKVGTCVSVGVSVGVLVGVCVTVTVGVGVGDWLVSRIVRVAVVPLVLVITIRSVTVPVGTGLKSQV